MDDLLNLAIQRLALPLAKFASNPSLLLNRTHQCIQSFQTTFFQSDSSEQVLLLVFTVLILFLLLRIIWRLLRGIVEFFVEVAKYLVLLALVLAVVQWRAEVKEVLMPYLQRYLTQQ
jgi:hypothetical protein